MVTWLGRWSPEQRFGGSWRSTGHRGDGAVAEKGEVEGVGGAFGYLRGLGEGAAALAPTAGEVAGAMAATTGVAAATEGWPWDSQARGTAGCWRTRSSGLSRAARTGRAERPVRRQHERRHAAPALYAALRQQHLRQPRKQPRLSHLASKSRRRPITRSDSAPVPAGQAPAAQTPEPPASAELRPAGATTSWPKTRRPRLSFAVRAKMSVALHVKKHGGSHSRSTE